MTSRNVHFEQLKKIGVHRIAVKDEALYNSEHGHHFVYCLLEGVCALTSISRNGDEKIYQYFKAGDLLGFSPIYSPAYKDDTFSAFSIIAKSDCILYEIPYTQFTYFINTHPHFYPWLVEITLQHYDGVLAHFHHLEHGNNLSNLCKALLELACVKDGQLHLHKCFSYAELSKYIGVHVITTTRLMKRLKEEGIIFKRGHHTIIADKAKLLEYIE
ncbi:Crp/Fnr family transcriptional regulator [Niameybacter massiliensis]|uniref:Crp/Fnr family transcriptional regulator n=1 Tax=Holtiella tumoricola TaxID=3018743 RepID=A0AA42DN01_9FIRM|nr:Crp/Fnr family transcriptional regulator [Holtiella tumoricola]MDA3731892.1 Crp/Fnr family transcriptional regulator [Holtiella tumoricola]